MVAIGKAEIQTFFCCRNVPR